MANGALFQHISSFVKLGIVLHAFTNLILIQGPCVSSNLVGVHVIFLKSPGEEIPRYSLPMVQV